jgi:glycosyltransferase involved in cell wall biosynthesis
VLPDGPLTRMTRTVVGAGASAIVGNSAFTLERFAITRTDALLAVEHSAVNLDCLSRATKLDRGAARAALDIPSHAGPVLGVIAQLTPWKAQDDALRIVSGLRGEHPGIRLVLAGSAKFASKSTRHDNQAFVTSLQAQVEDLGLQDRVSFLGERRDVPEVLRALDMLLVPSWEEPFGRSVVEALAVGVPVAATSAGGPREVLSDGVHGLLLPPRRPDAWVQALSPVLRDRVRLAEMSRQGPARAIAFGREAHAGRVLSLYEDVLARSSRRARRKRSPARPGAPSRSRLPRPWAEARR